MGICDSWIGVSIDNRQRPVLLNQVVFKTNVIVGSIINGDPPFTIIFIASAVNKGVIGDQNIIHPATLVALPPKEIPVSTIYNIIENFYGG